MWTARDLKTGTDLIITKVDFDNKNNVITITYDRNRWIVKIKQHSFVNRLKKRVCRRVDGIRKRR
jgi:hypothetical protein